LLHWLVVIPYYFLGALALSGLFAVTSRLLRLPVTIERVNAAAVFVSMATLAALLGSGIVGIDDLTIVPLVVLGLASFVLAGVDSVLMNGRPLLLEGGGRRSAGDPQTF
jgi:hypothetical protein